MKNIIIIVLSITTILSIGYGYIQKREADRCIMLAEQLAAKAEEFKNEAMTQRMAAEYLKRQAESSRNDAMQAMGQQKNIK